MFKIVRSITLISLICSPLFADAASPELRTVRLLPNDTVAYWVATDMISLKSKAECLNLWGVEKSPTFQTVLRQFEATHLMRWSHGETTWRDILDACTGEACLAVRKTKRDTPSTILLAEVGSKGARNRLLESLALHSKVFMPDVGDRYDVDLKLYSNSPDAPAFAYFVKDGLFVAVGDEESPEVLLSNWPGNNSLSEMTAHQKILERCADASASRSDIRWYLKPVDYVYMCWPRDEKMSTHPPRQFLRRAEATGFTAFEAIGGTCNVGRGQYALTTRTMIYAPDRNTPVMRVAPLPNGDWHAPPKWTPKDLYGCTSFYWRFRDASEGLSDFVDNIVGARGAWRDIQKAMQLDPRGPRVDLRNDLIPNVGGRVFVMTSRPTANDGVTGRGLAAVEISDPKTVAKTIDTMMDHDPQAELFKMAGVGFWMVDLDQSDWVELESELFEFEEAVPREPPRWLKRYYVGVANGYLMIGDDKELLHSVLESDSSSRRDNDFECVRSHLRSLMAGPVSVQSFSRHGDDFRLEARLSWLIPRLNHSWDRQTPTADDSKKRERPNSSWSPVLGPGGWAARREEDGWFAVGISLPRQAPQVTQAGACPQSRTGIRCVRVRRPLLRCLRFRSRRCGR